MKNILYGLVALFLVFVISSCGENGSTATSRTPTGNTVTQSEGKASVTLEADKTQVIANGTAGITLTVTVKDTTGSPLAQQEVTFNVPLSLALSYPPPTPLTTDDNGQVILLLRPLGPDTISPFNQYPTDIKQGDISATCLGVTSIPIAITVNPRPPVIISSVTLVANKTQAIADGTDTVIFTATVKDENGAPIPYQFINFNVPPGISRYISPVSTDANGIAIVRLSHPPILSNTNPLSLFTQDSSSVIGVSATSGLVTSNTVTVTYYNPQQVSPAAVTLASDKTSLIADGIDQIVFTITATDSNGYPVPNQWYRLSPPLLPTLISQWSTHSEQTLTNAAGQAIVSIKGYARPNVVGNATAVPIQITINGTTSNVLSLTISTP